MASHQGFADASGETTFTDVQRQGDTVTATSHASSTGTGPPHYESTKYTSAGTGATPNFEAMSIHDLKAWLEARGADLTGAIERSDLLDIARRMQGGDGGSS